MNLAHPSWLLLLLLLPLLATGAVVASRLRQRQWVAFAAPRLRSTLVKSRSPLARWLSLFFLLAASTAIIVALARPRGDAGTKMEKTTGRNVMIALDISKSMRVSDVKPDRLTQAKVVIYELLEAMPNERIGLIGFAGDAHTYAPLTIDHGAVRETIEQIDEAWAPLGGSDLAAAVHLATETLKKTGQKNNALVILSDGEENDGDLNTMITEAEQAGVYIITVGVGTEDGDYVPNTNFPNTRMVDRGGKTIISRLQPEVMRKLAEQTKGRFAIAGSGLDVPAMVKSVIAGLDAFELDGRERRISIEFYQWLVFPAVLFLTVSIVAATRWKGIQAALLLAGTFVMTPEAKAGEASTAKSLLTAGQFEQARDHYHHLAEQSRSREAQARYRLGEATAAYRAEDFRAARTAYSQSLLSQDSEVQANGHLGLGNSLFQLGWKGLSGESYPTDPTSIPDLDRFDTIVKEALAKLRETEEPEQGESSGYVQIESLISNWTDAIRHYDSALSGPVPRQNRQLTMTYLKRLEKLLDQEKKDTEQAMQQAGQGPPQQGGGDDEGEGEGEGDKGGKKGQNGDKKPGNKGSGNKKSKDGSGKDGEQDKNGKNGQDKDHDKKDGDKRGENPNESPQDRARRILKENADLEKGPLAPSRREFRDAEKDW
jgi:Ca-activated chloride channel homolog